MALNIKNPEVEALAAELGDLTGESKTEAIRRALLERRARVRLRVSESGRDARIHRFLKREVWSRVPEDQRGAAPSKDEREEILGYGRGGV
jgi:antitoxin VapB